MHAIAFGGKTPRYLPDLLFGENTAKEIYDVAAWREQIAKQMEKHSQLNS
jgi:hypothetical protein